MFDHANGSQNTCEERFFFLYLYVQWLEQGGEMAVFCDYNSTCLAGLRELGNGNTGGGAVWGSMRGIYPRRLSTTDTTSSIGTR